MPSVDESLLERNVEKESCISRLWEDVKLDFKLRDMHISEVGLMIE